jgi:hypothetical protein
MTSRERDVVDAALAFERAYTADSGPYKEAKARLWAALAALKVEREGEDEVVPLG